MTKKNFFALLSLNWGGQGGIEGSLESLTKHLQAHGSVRRVGYTTAKADCSLDVRITRGFIYKLFRVFFTGPIATAVHLAFFMRMNKRLFEDVNCFISRSPALTVGVLLSGVKGKIIYIPPASMREFYAGAMREAARNSNFGKFGKLFIVSLADRLMEKLAVGNSKVNVFAFSENVARKLKKDADGSVKNAFPGVRDIFKNFSGSREVIRERYLIPLERLVVLYVGRLEHGKNVDVLIEASHFISRQNALFVIVGGGHLQQSLRNSAGNNVVFLGEKDSSVVAELCFASDYCVLPTYEEGFGFVLAESLCLGTPVVGFGGSEVSTALDQFKKYFPEHCHVVTEKGAKALAESIDGLMDVAPISDVARELLRDRSRSVFDWDKFVTSILA